MVSLGCPKTLVDSEILLGKIPRGQYSLATDIAQSDVVLLNTCSFIEAAQKEFENDFLMASPTKGDPSSQQFVYSPDKLVGFTVVEASASAGEGITSDS